MVRETIDGKAIFLKRTRRGYVVKWGRTAIGFHTDPIEAVMQIIKLFGGEYEG